MFDFKDDAAKMITIMFICLTALVALYMIVPIWKCQ